MRNGFTLMEVNLAMFIMALGVLAMVGLYPLGFRENQQSREDLAAAVLADDVLNPIVSALSSPLCKWSDWENMVKASSKGWLEYCDEDNGDYVPKKRGNLKSTFASTLNKLKFASGLDPKGEVLSAVSKLDDLGYALVMTPGVRVDEDGTHVADYSRICLGFRATRRAAQLFAQPMFYTEVHFQGEK